MGGRKYDPINPPPLVRRPTTAPARVHLVFDATRTPLVFTNKDAADKEAQLLADTLPGMGDYVVATYQVVARRTVRPRPPARRRGPAA